MTTASESRKPGVQTAPSVRHRTVLAMAVVLVAATGCGHAATTEPAKLHLFGHVYDRGTIQLTSLRAATQRFGNVPIVSSSGSLERGSGAPLPTAVLLHTSAGYRNYDLSGAP